MCVRMLREALQAVVEAMKAKHRNLSMNVRFEKADFRWNQRTVHGTLEPTTNSDVSATSQSLTCSRVGARWHWQSSLHDG